MPLEGHPDDCECCLKITFTPGARGRKRTNQDADLTTFLPVAPGEDEGEENEGEEDVEEEFSNGDEEGALINSALFKAFDLHVTNLDQARQKRIEALSFKSALEDNGDAEINEDATQDEIDGLGVWMAGDEFQGDVNYRTLQKLLTRVDQRGFERYAHANPLRFSYPLRTSSLRCSGVSLALRCPKQVSTATRISRGLHESGRARDLPRQLGDGAPGHHEEVRLGKIKLRGFNFNAASLWKDVFVRRCPLTL